MIKPFGVLHAAYIGPMYRQDWSFGRLCTKDLSGRDNRDAKLALHLP